MPIINTIGGNSNSMPSGKKVEVPIDFDLKSVNNGIITNRFISDSEKFFDGSLYYWEFCAATRLSENKIIFFYNKQTNGSPYTNGFFCRIALIKGSKIIYGNETKIMDLKVININNNAERVFGCSAVSLTDSKVFLLYTHTKNLYEHTYDYEAGRETVYARIISINDMTPTISNPVVIKSSDAKTGFTNNNFLDALTENKVVVSFSKIWYTGPSKYPTDINVNDEYIYLLNISGDNISISDSLEYKGTVSDVNNYYADASYKPINITAITNSSFAVLRNSAIKGTDRLVLNLYTINNNKIQENSSEIFLMNGYTGFPDMDKLSDEKILIFCFDSNSGNLTFYLYDILLKTIIKKEVTDNTITQYQAGKPKIYALDNNNAIAFYSGKSVLKYSALNINDDNNIAIKNTITINEVPYDGDRYNLTALTNEKCIFTYMDSSTIISINGLFFDPLDTSSVYVGENYKFTSTPNGPLQYLPKTVKKNVLVNE
jgi:hypothetical protein